MIGLDRGVFAPDLPASRPEIAALCRAILEALDLTGREFDLRLAGDAAVEALNREFLGLPGPTNILSFPAEDPDRPEYLGELALSLDAVRREAFLYGQPPGLHMARLLAHGFLHLAGFEHGPLMESLTETAAESAAARLGLSD